MLFSHHKYILKRNLFKNIEILSFNLKNGYILLKNKEWAIKLFPKNQNFNSVKKRKITMASQVVNVSKINYSEIM